MRRIIAGTMVNHDAIEHANLTMEEDKILSLETLDASIPGVEDFTAQDCLIFPGFGDIHVHTREDASAKQNYKEDYDSANDAAINGGVVFAGPKPNQPEPVDSDERYLWHLERTKDLPVTFIPYALIGPNTMPLTIWAPYKAFQGKSVGDEFFRTNEQMRDALSRYAIDRLPPPILEYQSDPSINPLKVAVHVEHHQTIEDNKHQRTHNRRRPREAVIKGLEDILELQREFRFSELKLCHWPVGEESFDMIQKARDEGHNITLEVSPLHLYFDADMCEERPELWPYLQMNPALQTAQDRRDLIAALREGFINYLATDHAPHTLDEKFKNFEGGESGYLKMLNEDPDQCREISCMNGTSGTPQLDTYAAICAWLMLEHDFSPQRIAQIACENPAQFMSSYTSKKFGRIAPGYQASLTVLRFDKKIFSRDDLKTKPGWSPFENREFPGYASDVMIDGTWVKRDDTLINPSSSGRTI